jgi:hypothetical protein
MTIDANQMAQTIVDSVEGTHAKFGTLLPRAEGATVTTTFCATWAKAKPVLSVLAGFAMWIPGFGATAAGVLHGLIKVGDLIAAELGCPVVQ